MKKLTLAIAASMVALSSGSAMAEEEWIPQGNGGSQQVQPQSQPQQQPTRFYGNGEVESGEVKYSKTGSATTLSSGTSSESDESLSLGDLSANQKSTTSLQAEIKRAELELQLAEIKSKIRDLTGETLEEEEEVSVEMIGSHGKNGKIFATISYNDTQFDVEKGDILNEDWVILDVTFNTIVMFNVETKDQKTLQFNGPTLDKKYQKK